MDTSTAVNGGAAAASPDWEQLRESTRDAGVGLADRPMAAVGQSAEAPSLLEQTSALCDMAIDCQLMAVEDPWRLSPADQLSVDAEIEELSRRTLDALEQGEPNPDLFFDDTRWPGIEAWLRVRKLAVALHPLYSAGSFDSLGQGLSLSDFTSTLIGGLSATEWLHLGLSDVHAERILRKYQSLLETPMSPSVRRQFLGCLDARGIRTRAVLAGQLLSDALPDRIHAVELASLACGAAGPMAAIAAQLGASGRSVSRLHLVDRDPMALAAASRIIAGVDHGSEVRLVLADLVDLVNFRAADLTRHFESSVDAVDMLGLFEYLPDDLAVDLLCRVREIMAPNGVVLLANMLRPRPQQTMFEHVVQWPALVQRTLPELGGLCLDAGFETDDIQIRISANEQVYAVAALRVSGRAPNPLV